jgi:hypothetical protein
MRTKIKRGENKIIFVNAYRTDKFRLSIVVVTSPIFPLDVSNNFACCTIPSPFGIDEIKFDSFIAALRARIKFGTVFKLEISLNVRPIKQSVLIRINVERGSVCISNVSQTTGTTGLSFVVANIFQNQFKIDSVVV